MNKFLLPNILRFIFLILFQILVLNVLPFGKIYIMIYPLFILLLPVYTPKSILLLIAFFTGILLDAFSNGGGLHTASLLAMSYFREYILYFFQPKSKWDKLDVPSLKEQGSKWFFYYSLILISIHHFLFFYLDVFSFQNFHIVFLKVILSTFSSLVLVWVVSLLFMRNVKE